MGGRFKYGKCPGQDKSIPVAGLTVGHLYNSTVIQVSGFMEAAVGEGSRPPVPSHHCDLPDGAGTRVWGGVVATEVGRSLPTQIY